MGPNILYDKNETYMSIQTLQEKNEYTTTGIITKYNTLISSFEKSESAKLTALLEQLQEEKRTVLQLSKFYRALLKMLQNAAKDVDRVEEHYNTTKVNP